MRALDWLGVAEARLLRARATKQLDERRVLARGTVERGREAGPLSLGQHESGAVAEQALSALTPTLDQELRERLLRRRRGTARKLVIIRGHP